MFRCTKYNIIRRVLFGFPWTRNTGTGNTLFLANGLKFGGLTGTYFRGWLKFVKGETTFAGSAGERNTTFMSRTAVSERGMRNGRRVCPSVRRGGDCEPKRRAPSSRRTRTTGPTRYCAPNSRRRRVAFPVQFVQVHYNIPNNNHTTAVRKYYRPSTTCLLAAVGPAHYIFIMYATNRLR